VPARLPENGLKLRGTSLATRMGARRRDRYQVNAPLAQRWTKSIEGSRPLRTLIYSKSRRRRASLLT
jgi:hypothetical protein